MTHRRLWTRNELLLAINLYCKIPFGKIHLRNPEIMNLASLINRTPSAVAWKLVNFASFDPSLKLRGIQGARNASKLDREIWDEFFEDWEALAVESEMLLLKTQKSADVEPDFEKKEGIEKERTIKARVNQSFFRSSLLASYNNKCCITGISNTELLIASHIVPWSVDSKNRLNPRNGILVNALHDKAFEYGFITITTDFKILVCDDLLNSKNENSINYFHKHHNQDLILPSRFLPDSDFLKYHNQEKFKK